MRRVSANARRSQDAQQTDETQVLLVMVEHPDIDGGVIRLSTDPAARVSSDPVTYGTYSKWRGYWPLLTEDDSTLLTEDDSPIVFEEEADVVNPFLFIMMDIVIPDEKDDAGSQAALVLAMLDSAIGDVLRSTTVQAVCHMAVVMASSPDVIEAEWLDLLATDARIDPGKAMIQFSTESIYDEPCAADRMTKERWPGLHR